VPEPTSHTLNVVAGLIYRDGLLLVCQRHVNSAFPLRWEFPGGKVEKDELEIDALRRELTEELAIEVIEASLFDRHQHVYPNGTAVSLSFFHVLKFTGEVKNLVFQQISWERLSDLERLDFLEGDRPLIARLISEGKTGLPR
jgi:8-oxo-dGTP diphosphatase